MISASNMEGENSVILINDEERELLAQKNNFTKIPL